MTDLLQVNLTNSVWLGARNVLLIGLDFGFDPGAVIVSPTTDINDADRAVISPIAPELWSDSQISVDLPITASLPGYFFVQRVNGEYNLAGLYVTTQYATLDAFHRWTVKERGTTWTSDDSGLMTSLVKAPGERRLYTADFSTAPEILSGQVIVGTPTVVSSASGLTLEAVSVVGATAQLWISGGTAEHSYELTATVETDGGATLIAHTSLVVRDSLNKTLEMYSGEVERFEFDLSAQEEIAAGQIIASVTSVVGSSAGIIVGGGILDATSKKVQVQIAGLVGQVGYEVTATVLLNGGGTLVEKGSLVVV